jgi:hypothetical protein
VVQHGEEITKMARKIWIDGELWSEDWFRRMTPDEKLLYFGILAHADDDGLVEATSDYLKGRVFPHCYMPESMLVVLRSGVLNKVPEFEFHRDKGGHEYIRFDWSSIPFVTKEEPIEDVEGDGEPAG